MPYDFTTLARLWSYVDKSANCWMWTGNTDEDGYGIIWANGKSRRAHRIICELMYGPLPRTTQTRHTCDTPGCCRPAHLLPGTAYQNTQDCLERGRFKGAHRGAEHHLRVHPERVARGESRPDAKLTAALVVELRQRYAAGGESYYTLARAFGIAPQTVCKVVLRKSWAHIP